MKKTGILILLMSLHTFISPTLWAQAPIVDDSDNFMLADAADEMPETAPLAKSQIPQDSFHSEARARPYDDAAAYDEPETLEPIARDNLPDSAPANNASEQIQALQDEVQELRGQLEVQAHDLKLLQQQQLAFYKDLDRRMQGIQGKSATAKSDAENSAFEMPSSKASSTRERVNPANEQISYLAAYDLIKTKRYEEAASAMQNFIQNYPQGGYTANAHYWLGEIYLLQNNPDRAIFEFDKVLRRFPASSKAAASELKKAYALADKGEQAQAKTILQEILKKYPDTNTARLASTKLESL